MVKLRVKNSCDLSLKDSLNPYYIRSKSLVFFETHQQLEQGEEQIYEIKQCINFFLPPMMHLDITCGLGEVLSDIFSLCCVRFYIFYLK